MVTPEQPGPHIQPQKYDKKIAVSLGVKHVHNISTGPKQSGCESSTRSCVSCYMLAFVAVCGDSGEDQNGFDHSSPSGVLWCFETLLCNTNYAG